MSWVCSPWSIIIISNINNGRLLGDCRKSVLESYGTPAKSDSMSTHLPREEGEKDGEINMRERVFMRLRKRDFVCICAMSEEINHHQRLN